MKKTYYIVDGENYQVCYGIVSFWGDYSESPKERRGENLASIAFCCGGCGLCIGFINSKASFLHSVALESIAWGLICMALVLFAVGAIYMKLADNEGKDSKCKKTDLPWSDPYHLAGKYAADIPGKKTYYIVDGGKNAIVDVKRLGKWGQRYVAWRGKRQKQKTE